MTTQVPAVTVQQIVYVRSPEQWSALAAALGFVAPFAAEDGWAEFDGGGVLAMHRATDEHPEGTVDLHLLVDDLDAAERSLEGWDVTRSDLAGVGEILTVRGTSGVMISVSAGIRATTGKVLVQPVWFTRDTAEARGILESLGLRADIVSDRGGWIELHAGGGGSVGVHDVTAASEASDPSISLGFLACGDLDDLARRLADAGFEASIVDESYARTIRITDPEVWINGGQHDLYGYHSES